MPDPFGGDDLLAPPGAEAHATTAACPYCQRERALDVTPFRWQRERLLQWTCRWCGNVWIVPERRGHDR
jgi:hypothetical protein